jgi:Mg/Co/Ni transporter MgtE
MNPNDQISALLESMSDDDIKKLISDFTDLQKVGVLPVLSPFRDLTIKVCNLYNVDYNLKIGESWLQNEVFRRFLNKV